MKFILIAFLTLMPQSNILNDFFNMSWFLTNRLFVFDSFLTIIFWNWLSRIVPMWLPWNFPVVWLRRVKNKVLSIRNKHRLIIKKLTEVIASAIANTWINRIQRNNLETCFGCRSWLRWYHPTKSRDCPASHVIILRAYGNQIFFWQSHLQ